jgi:hypothetical protein
MTPTDIASRLAAAAIAARLRSSTRSTAETREAADLIDALSARLANAACGVDAKQHSKLENLLRSIEWSGKGFSPVGYYSCCPVCSTPKYEDGHHTRNCALAVLLSTPSPKPEDALREALRQIARQPLSTEMDPNDVDDADFVGGYDTEITIARAALAKERT